MVAADVAAVPRDADRPWRRADHVMGGLPGALQAAGIFAPETGETGMQLGAVLSQNEISDLGALRDYAQAVQELGYDFLVAADHVVGSEAGAHPELERVYPIENVLHEPLALFAHLAAAA